MRFIFWNVMNNDKIFNALIDIILTEKIDVVILSECSKLDIKKLNAEISTSTSIKFKVLHSSNDQRTNILYKESIIIKKKSTTFYAQASLIESFSVPINLISLHLPSQLFKEEDEVSFKLPDISLLAKKVEKSAKNDYTVIVGDFNINPFNKLLVAAEGLHAIMCPLQARKNTRKVDHTEYKFFYNPTWNLLGKYDNEVLGTYHYDSGSTCYYWNAFDQVLVRPSLIDRFNMDYFRVIHSTKKYNLLNADLSPNRDNFSDHLPIVFELK